MARYALLVVQARNDDDDDDDDDDDGCIKYTWKTVSHVVKNS